MKNKNFVLFLFICFAAIGSSFTLSNKHSEKKSEETAASKINWVSMEEAVELQKTDPKLILVDVYMNNCPYCTKMDKSTFGHPKVKEYINKHFYAVKLNAFTNQKIKIGDREYKVDKKSRYRNHELASYLLKGNMQFPSTVFIEENFKPVNSIGGYLDASEFDQVMRYYGGGFYKKISWGVYMRNSKSRISK
ncbi:MAG: thioredoxin family protein [Chitinophagales bacterium]